MIDAAPPPEPSLPALYREHRSWLETWLRRRLGNAWDAADLSQDTFLRVLTSAQPLADIREPRAYLLTVGKRLLSNFYQRRSWSRPTLMPWRICPSSTCPRQSSAGCCWKPCKPWMSCSMAEGAGAQGLSLEPARRPGLRRNRQAPGRLRTLGQTLHGAGLRTLPAGRVAMTTHSPETREAVRAAARWLALLDSGNVSETDLLRLAQWRASNRLHEDAWQKASVLRERFSGLPGAWPWPLWTVLTPAAARSSSKPWV